MPHADEGQINAYLDEQGEFADTQRRRALGQHIADCSACTKLLIDVRRIRADANNIIGVAKLETKRVPSFDDVVQRAQALRSENTAADTPAPPVADETESSTTSETDEVVTAEPTVVPPLDLDIEVSPVADFVPPVPAEDPDPVIIFPEGGLDHIGMGEDVVSPTSGEHDRSLEQIPDDLELTRASEIELPALGDDLGLVRSGEASLEIESNFGLGTDDPRIMDSLDTTESLEADKTSQDISGHDDFAETTVERNEEPPRRSRPSYDPEIEALLAEVSRTEEGVEEPAEPNIIGSIDNVLPEKAKDFDDVPPEAEVIVSVAGYIPPQQSEAADTGSHRRSSSRKQPVSKKRKSSAGILALAATVVLAAAGGWTFRDQLMTLVNGGGTLESPTLANQPPGGGEPARTTSDEVAESDDALARDMQPIALASSDSGTSTPSDSTVTLADETFSADRLAAGERAAAPNLPEPAIAPPPALALNRDSSGAPNLAESAPSRTDLARQQGVLDTGALLAQEKRSETVAIGPTWTVVELSQAVEAFNGPIAVVDGLEIEQIEARSGGAGAPVQVRVTHRLESGAQFVLEERQPPVGGQLGANAAQVRPSAIQVVLGPDGETTGTARLGATVVTAKVRLPEEAVLTLLLRLVQAS